VYISIRKLFICHAEYFGFWYWSWGNCGVSMYTRMFFAMLLSNSKSSRMRSSTTSIYSTTSVKPYLDPLGLVFSITRPAGLRPWVKGDGLVHYFELFVKASMPRRRLRCKSELVRSHGSASKSDMQLLYAVRYPALPSMIAGKLQIDITSRFLFSKFGCAGGEG
jgi:hypothetical protein